MPTHHNASFIAPWLALLALLLASSSAVAAPKPMPPKNLTAAVAKLMKAKPADVKLEILPGDPVPGLVVFSARASANGAALYCAGVADSKQLYFGAKAGMQVMKAWNYTPARAVQASTVAQVMGLLEAGRDNEIGSDAFATAALVTAADITAFKCSPGESSAVKATCEANRAKAVPPEDVAVDGQIGVEYWMTVAGRIYRSQVLLGAYWAVSWPHVD